MFKQLVFLATIVFGLTCLSISTTNAANERCGGGPATIVGEGVIKGTSGNDTIVGSMGDDIIYGNYGKDTICGNGGNDTIYGGAGDDRIWGGQGEDTIYGDLGNDTINGDRGADRLFGGWGSDTLNGGSPPSGVQEPDFDQCWQGPAGAFELTSQCERVYAY